MKFAKMKQDLSQYLLPELITDIFLRLPIESIIRCKCVCKSWLDLIRSPEFVKSHLCNSKSIPGLAFFEEWSNRFDFHKFVDEHDESITLRFSLPTPLKIVQDCSVNGLLLFSDRFLWPDNYFISNPVTRDYIKLPSSSHKHHYQRGIGYGFGVSKKSGEYKIVSVTETKCEVYTLGTGSWRCVEPYCHDHKTWSKHKKTATFVNGNLHWLLHDPHSTVYGTVVGISCFDLETELFTIFSPPLTNVYGIDSALCDLEECLAFSHNAGGSLVIWLMNKYGDDKSWTKKFIFPQPYDSSFPIKVFNDTDILISQAGYSWLFFYKAKTNQIQDKNSLKRRVVSYSPSFLPLKTFSAENVCSF